MLFKMLTHLVPIGTITDKEASKNLIRLNIVVVSELAKLLIVNIVHGFLNSIDKQDGGGTLALGRLIRGIATTQEPATNREHFHLRDFIPRAFHNIGIISHVYPPYCLCTSALG